MAEAAEKKKISILLAPGCRIRASLNEIMAKHTGQKIETLGLRIRADNEQRARSAHGAHAAVSVLGVQYQ